MVILHQKQARDVKTYRPRRDEYVKYRVYESEFYAKQYAPRDTKQRSRKIKYPHCVRYVRKIDDERRKHDRADYKVERHRYRLEFVDVRHAERNADERDTETYAERNIIIDVIRQQ